jgi:hypothetical protein
MLELLQSSGDALLDDAVMINTIKSSAAKRAEVAARLEQTQYDAERLAKERGIRVDR